MNLIWQNICIFLFFLFILLIITPLALAVSGPTPPMDGPGGTNYTHKRVISNTYGSGALQYYIFEPDEPKPLTAPLIAFTHGWGNIEPDIYGAWIEHIVKKGNVVVFPVYQSLLSSSQQYAANSIQSILEAIEVLQAPDRVRPDVDRFAVVGHSVGGILAVNIAAMAEKSALPVPKAVMSVEPGRSSMVPLHDLSLIPSGTILLTIVGDQDRAAGDQDAIKIFNSTPQIPSENKDFIIMVSDQHGSPSITANHLAPFCMSSGKALLPGSEIIDALDYYCLWKLFDALIDAAFYEENQEYALGNTPQQRYMGEWSDGVPINELFVTDHP